MPEIVTIYAKVLPSKSDTATETLPIAAAITASKLPKNAVAVAVILLYESTANDVAGPIIKEVPELASRVGPSNVISVNPWYLSKHNNNIPAEEIIIPPIFIHDIAPI